MYDIQVETYKTKDQFHYVKVEIDGLYISGIKVSTSTKYPNSLWIQMPSYKQGPSWKRYIESRKDSVLGQAIYKAIETHMSPIVFGGGEQMDNTPRPASKDVVLEDIEDGPIDLSEIPF